VSLCSTRVSDGCGAQIWSRLVEILLPHGLFRPWSCQGKAKTAEDPMLALRIVLIVLGLLILIGAAGEFSCGWCKAQVSQVEVS